MKCSWHAVLGFFLLSAGAVAHAETAPALQRMCLPDAAPAAYGMAVRTVAAAPGDFPGVEAVSSRTGAVVRIYHDPALADAARAEAVCFAGMMDFLETVVPEVAPGRHWQPMVITADKDYVAAKRSGEVRWVNLFDAGTWDARALNFLQHFLPHEETHSIQSQAKSRLPRWFTEGHAEWASLHVAEQAAPAVAGAARAHFAAEMAGKGALHLGAWGGMRVKPEAIDRQLGPEDRARREKDPAFMPQVSFKFGPGDFVEDNSNAEARYGASLAIFDGLERRHGLAAVQQWVHAVLAAEQPGQTVPLARQMLGEDISALLN